MPVIGVARKLQIKNSLVLPVLPVLPPLVTGNVYIPVINQPEHCLHDTSIRTATNLDSTHVLHLMHTPPSLQVVVSHEIVYARQVNGGGASLHMFLTRRTAAAASLRCLSNAFAGMGMNMHLMRIG